MKIYTKTGDSGTTSLVGGTRVSKAHPRVMAYGDLDELISWLGLIRCETSGQDFPLRRIQIHLMNASAHLANDGKSFKLKPLDEGRTYHVFLADFLLGTLDLDSCCFYPLDDLKSD